jgi:acyl-CoA synthetase (AMP-forming)/AMP-acid ligase II
MAVDHLDEGKRSACLANQEETQMTFPKGHTLADLFIHAQPNHPAVILPEAASATTYRGLASQIDALAARLQTSPVQPPEAVAIVLPNGLEYIASFLAVTRAGLQERRVPLLP